jgi:hypothetical protein
MVFPWTTVHPPRSLGDDAAFRGVRIKEDGGLAAESAILRCPSIYPNPLEKVSPHESAMQTGIIAAIEGIVG